MPYRGVKGELDEIQFLKKFEWKIRDFSSLCKDNGSYYHSRPFNFANNSWRLRIYPQGDSKAKDGFISVSLFKDAELPCNISFTISLKKIDGTLIGEQTRTREFLEHDWGVRNFFQRSNLLREESGLLPSDILTIVCHMKLGTEETVHSMRLAEKPENAVNTDTISTSNDDKKYMNQEIKCPQCASVVFVKDIFNHGCQTKTEKEMEKLGQDMKALMLSGDHSDTTINVKGEEFRLHRNILTARNPFFNAMFKSDMKEKTTGVVRIEDCEPGVFRSFIHYLYTGRVDTLSSKNVCGLYEMVDKYEDDELKEKCYQLLKDTISVDNFCDVIALALKCNEKELIQEATGFFTENMKEIIRTMKWQIFLNGNTTCANELLIKALDHYQRK